MRAAIATAVLVACSGATVPPTRDHDAGSPSAAPPDASKQGTPGVASCEGTCNCDDGADCDGSNVCCAEQTETDSNPYAFSTYCRTSCITNIPRVKVCVSDADCKGTSGRCKDWSCGGFQMHGIKTCDPLGACD